MQRSGATSHNSDLRAKKLGLADAPWPKLFSSPRYSTLPLNEPSEWALVTGMAANAFAESLRGSRRKKGTRKREILFEGASWLGMVQ